MRYRVIVVCSALVACGGSSSKGAAPDGGSAAVDGPVSSGPPPADGLLAHWTMDALDPGATDATGRGHDGTCNQTTCPMLDATGEIAAAYSFTAGNMLTVADAPELETTTGFTVAGWLEIAALPTATACAFTKELGTSGRASSWSVCLDPSGRLNFSSASTTTQDVLGSAPDALTPNTWTHVAITWDGTTKSLYIGGALGNDDKNPIGFDDNPIIIGAQWVGNLDDVRLYNSALTAAEIATLATN